MLPSTGQMVLGLEVISPQGLEELQYYKYQGTDRSYLNNFVMNRFWNWLIEFMPLSIAPNVITLVGFIGMIGSTAYAIYCNPTFRGALPLDAIVIVFVLVFLYQTLDALDGKQARRTKNSTPLGQLFDHGCDAVSMCCFAMLGGSVCRTGADSPFFLAFFFSALVAFFLAQWEEYWTGVIDLGEVGVTEGQMMGLLLYVIAGFFGSEVYLRPAFTVFGYHATVGECILSVFVFAFCATIVQNAVRVSKATPRASEKLRAILQLLPVFSLTVAFVAWIIYSPARLASTHPVPLLVAAGIFFPACVERMVVCRLTKDEVPFIYIFTLPVFVGVAQALFIGNAEYDVLLIRINAVVAVLSYLHFAVAVISQITNYFDIKAFAINRPLQWPLKSREKHVDTPKPKTAKPATRTRSRTPTRGARTGPKSAPAAQMAPSVRTRSSAKKTE